MARKVNVNPEDEMLTPPQIAQIWGCSPETVRKIIETEELKAVNFSRGEKQPRYKCKRKWVDAYVDARARASRPLPRRRKRVVRTNFSI